MTPEPPTLEYGNLGEPLMGSKDGSSHGSFELLSVGFVLVTCIVLGYLVGDYVDVKMEIGPWGVVTGVMVGTGAGFLNLFRTVTRNQK